MIAIGVVIHRVDGVAAPAPRFAGAACAHQRPRLIVLDLLLCRHRESDADVEAAEHGVAGEDVQVIEGTHVSVAHDPVPAKACACPVVEDVGLVAASVRRGIGGVVAGDLLVGLQGDVVTEDDLLAAVGVPADGLVDGGHLGAVSQPVVEEHVPYGYGARPLDRGRRRCHGVVEVLGEVEGVGEVAWGVLAQGQCCEVHDILHDEKGHVSYVPSSSPFCLNRSTNPCGN